MIICVCMCICMCICIPLHLSVYPCSLVLLLRHRKFRILPQFLMLHMHEKETNKQKQYVSINWTRQKQECVRAIHK